MISPTAAPPARPVRSHLAAWLLAWLAVIVYVSLHPWSGWRVPGVPLLAFLSEPWPRYWTRLDLMMNLVAYVPLGLLGATWLARRLPTGAAAVTSVVCAGLLSCSLEALQTLLPARVSSLPDLLLNVAGAFVGALVVLVVGPRRLEALPIAIARALALAPGSGPGVLLLAAWLAVQCHPQSVAFASGELLPLLAGRFPALDGWLQSIRLSGEWQPVAEVCAIAATTLGVGLLARDLVRNHSRTAIALPIVLGALAKSAVSANLLGARNALAWLSAGTQGGMLAGALLLVLGAWWRPRARLLTAIAALAIATVLHNLLPPNVYFESTIAGWQQGGWTNVNGLLRALAVVWPFAAIAWALWRLRQRRGIL